MSTLARSLQGRRLKKVQGLRYRRIASPCSEDEVGRAVVDESGVQTVLVLNWGVIPGLQGTMSSLLESEVLRQEWFNPRDFRREVHPHGYIICFRRGFGRDADLKTAKAEN